MRDIPLEPGGLQVQVTATLPEPFWEHAIAESWLNAVDNAERYIYIEDQYFRAPMLHERIYARMQQIPDLRLVVITKPINEWTDPGCYHTYAANTLFESSFPSSRYMTLQLRAFDYVVTWGIDETESRFADMDVHSKMLLVDDIFMSVGSANKNNRGMIYEGELNVAVVDQTFVTAQRRRILEQMLPPGVTVSDDVASWWSLLSQAASANDIVYANWEAEGGDISLDGAPLPSEYSPRGWLYHLAFNPTEECLFESVGPDMTSAPEGAGD
jgi:phosphatidylserine/phosphatidylglycerophosphate/cardiolipin synthase-like enzyme